MADLLPSRGTVVKSVKMKGEREEEKEKGRMKEDKRGREEIRE